MRRRLVTALWPVFRGSSRLSCAAAFRWDILADRLACNGEVPELRDREGDPSRANHADLPGTAPAETRSPNCDDSEDRVELARAVSPKLAIRGTSRAATNCVTVPPELFNDNDLPEWAQERFDIVKPQANIRGRLPGSGFQSWHLHILPSNRLPSSNQP